MAKAISSSSTDLKSEQTKTQGAGRQRSSVPSSELVPLQFKMPPEFVRAFKQEALNRDMKLNELLSYCFDDFMKNNQQ